MEGGGGPLAAGNGAPKRKAVTLTLEQKASVLRWWRAAPAGTGRQQAAAWVKATYGLIVSLAALTNLRKEADAVLERAESAGGTSCSRTRRSPGLRTRSTSSSAPPTP